MHASRLQWNGTNCLTQCQRVAGHGHGTRRYLLWPGANERKLFSSRQVQLQISHTSYIPLLLTTISRVVSEEIACRAPVRPQFCNDAQIKPITCMVHDVCMSSCSFLCSQMVLFPCVASETPVDTKYVKHLDFYSIIIYFASIRDAFTNIYFGTRYWERDE